MISGINLGHLGADLSILRCKKRFRGVITPKKKGRCHLHPIQFVKEDSSPFVTACFTKNGSHVRAIHGVVVPKCTPVYTVHVCVLRVCPLNWVNRRALVRLRLYCSHPSWKYG
jgi:hypothetical protein